MSYSVKELRENLAKKVYGLGINPKFKDNPAFASALAEIDSLISEMNISNESDKVNVIEEKGSISFKWNSQFNEKYEMSISCSDPDTFKCTRFKESKKHTQSWKEAEEVVATIGEYGNITLFNNSGSVTTLENYNKDHKCMCFSSATRKEYSANGVMNEREYRNYTTEESQDFSRYNPDFILNTAREAYRLFLYDEIYNKRELYVRDKLDTARLVFDDKEEKIRYSVIVPLSQQHGLRDMYTTVNDPCKDDIVILPLSKEQIEAMIQKENNPKVQEGLRAYATGRENYYYNSSEDKNFINTIENSKGRHK